MAPDTLKTTQNLIAQTIKNDMKFNKPPEADAEADANLTGENYDIF